ncbi:Hypothetical protein BHY_1359 (plasmid) [Borrelia nietonii YOR]|uniref:Uncharacterized protein n=1 Tax=Borrelia nietonii YOR TaxID=1293576 RepID=W5SBJ2_9SPIR|nr:Hypothetical protein BHY_1359 [Borrelia nietonii YOR]
MDFLKFKVEHFFKSNSKTLNFANKGSNKAKIGKMKVIKG